MAGAIITGEGASGVVAAAQLLRRGAEVTLLEPAVELGWEYATCSFAPRSLYIRSVLDEALRRGPGKFRHLCRRAVDARVRRGNIAVETEESGMLHGDAVILATATPRRPAGQVSLRRSHRDERPPCAGAATGKRADRGGCPARAAASLALRQGVHGVAPGASAADACAASGFHSTGNQPGLAGVELRRAAAFSPPSPAPLGHPQPPDGAADRNGGPRFASRRQPRSADRADHRMAPQIGTVVHGSLRDGSLEVLTGRTYGLRLVQDGVEVSIAIRGCTEIKTLKVERVVNCTGPDTDLSRAPIRCCAIWWSKAGCSPVHTGWAHWPDESGRPLTGVRGMAAAALRTGPAALGGAAGIHRPSRDPRASPEARGSPDAGG